MHFCARCGTKLCLTFERFPGIRGVYAGAFDRPGRVIAFPARTWRILLDEAMPGTMVPAGAPTWPRHRYAEDGAEHPPRICEEHRVLGG